MPGIDSEREALAIRGYEVRVSEETGDAAWDAFLIAAGGEYPQSSLWARVKSGSGYKTRRITVHREGTIVGGAQLLVRTLPLAGAFGYVPVGPVLAPMLEADAAALASLVVEQLRTLARKEGLRFAAVQLPAGSPAAEILRAAGFLLPTPKLAPTASILIRLNDASADDALIFSQMSATTRKHIRRSERGGVTVRRGGSSDLARFHRLSCATAQRRGFPVPNEEYVSRVWSAFAATGNIEIFVAELGGEAVSALIVIAFGDTVTCWRMGWAGKQAGVYPNEAMHWAAIQWAKAQGYRRFDLGGIHLEVARSSLAGENTRSNDALKVDYFKLGFGGTVTLFPEAFGFVPNPGLRWAWPLLSRAMTRFRGASRWALSRFAGGA